MTIPYSVALSQHLGHATFVENHGSIFIVERYGGVLGDEPPSLSQTAVILVGGFVNSLTVLSADLEGRHYGGGVLELVPSEIERLAIPVPRGDSRRLLSQLDSLVRDRVPPQELLYQQDALVFPAAPSRT